MKSFSDKNDFEKFSEIRSQLIDLGVERVLKHIGEPLLRDFSGDIVKEEFVPWDVVKSQMSDSFCGDIYENFSRKRNRAYDAKKQFTSEELGRSLEKFLKEDFSNKWYNRYR